MLTKKVKVRVVQWLQHRHSQGHSKSLLAERSEQTKNCPILDKNGYYATGQLFEFFLSHFSVFKHCRLPLKPLGNARVVIYSEMSDRQIIFTVMSVPSCKME